MHDHQGEIVNARLAGGEVLRGAQHGKQHSIGGRATHGRAGCLYQPLRAELFAPGVLALKNSIRVAQ